MIGPEVDVELVEELRVALGTGELARWAAAVRNRGADPFRALEINRDVSEDLCRAAGYPGLSDWVLDVHRWVDQMHRPDAVLDHRQEILRLAWEALADDLATSLRRARLEALSLPQGSLPSEGGVLVFVDGISLCLVVRYRFVADVPELSVVSTIREPRSAFDIVDDLIRHDHTTRNTLKRILQSSHRLVWHRGVLGHVDRRIEPTVFGPSIDTLYMAEILARRYRGSGRRPSRILEVGTGSGFLSAGLIRNVIPDALVGFEADASAAACTARNVAINRESTDPGDTRVSIVFGRFMEGLLEPPFDLIVCNPPYIPSPPGRRPTTMGDRGDAVAGLTLIDELLRGLPRLLGGQDAEVLLMVSSVTPPDYVMERLPEGFTVAADAAISRTRRVLFEVEEIFDLPGHLTFLEGSGGIYREGISYVHDLHPVWITIDR
jgi:release factor glutamine methyltransferase